MPGPWFAKPWRRTASGGRAVVATCGYLAGGVGGLILAFLADATAQRVLWALFGVVFVGLGSTLAATLAHRRAASARD